MGRAAVRAEFEVDFLSIYHEEARKHADSLNTDGGGADELISGNYKGNDLLSVHRLETWNEKECPRYKSRLA